MGDKVVVKGASAGRGPLQLVWRGEARCVLEETSAVSSCSSSTTTAYQRDVCSRCHRGSLARGVEEGRNECQEFIEQEVCFVRGAVGKSCSGQGGSHT